MGLMDEYREREVHAARNLRDAARNLSDAAHGLYGVVRYHYPDHEYVRLFENARTGFRVAMDDHLKAMLNLPKEDT